MLRRQQAGWRPLDVLALVGLASLALLTFGESLAFAFMGDDPVTLPMGEGRPLWSILTASDPIYPYYRPVAFIIWQALRGLLGRYDPFWFHLLPVVAHILNAWLVYLLVARLLSRPIGLLSAALFTLYPFSYQVVPWASALFHSWVTLFALASLFFYLEARARRSRALLLASLLLGVATPFAHESGVAIGALAVALEAFLHSRDEEDHFHLSSLLYLLPSLAFLAVWISAPKSRALVPLGLEALSVKGATLLQGLIYPVAGVLGPLGRRIGLSPERLAWPAIALGWAVLLLLYWRGRRLALFILGVFWFLVTVLPAWLTLEEEYVRAGARLLYLASPGAILLWAGLFDLEWDLESKRALWRLAMIGMLALVMAQGYTFIQRRNLIYRWGTKLVSEMVEAAQGRPVEERLIFLDVPAWASPWQGEYPLWHSGVVFIPGWMELWQEFHIYDGIRRDVLSQALASSLVDWRFNSAPHGPLVDGGRVLEAVKSAPSASVYQADFRKDGLKLRELGSFAGHTAPEPEEYQADFEGRFRLVGARAEWREGGLRLELGWLCQRPSFADYTVFAHLYGGDGQMLGQADGYPLGGLLPLKELREGEQVRDLRLIGLAEGLSPGQYQMAVGLYDRATLKRLAAFDPKGTRFAGDAVVMPTPEPHP